jgi:hypothetical protein
MGECLVLGRAVATLLLQNEEAEGDEQCSQMSSVHIYSKTYGTDGIILSENGYKLTHYSPHN